MWIKVDKITILSTQINKIVVRIKLSNMIIFQL